MYKFKSIGIVNDGFWDFLFPISVYTATYYVKNGGNNNLDGLSDATAWKTINKVNSYSFTTGDDIYFKCGGTWTGTQLWIDWSGTAANRVVIGAYYGDGIIGVSGNKPIIDGNDVAPGPIPCETGCWAGLIHIENQNYIDLKNIYAVNAEGYGVRAIDCENINIHNIKTENTYRSGIQLRDCNNNGGSSVIENCDVGEYSCVWPEYCKSHGCTWPGGIVGLGTHNLIIRKNIIHEGHGEGIYFGNTGVNQDGSNCLIEDNILYDCRAVSIYTHNAGDIVIRRNLVYGTGNPTYCNRFVYDGVYFTGPGIYVTDEKWWAAGFQMDNIKIYNNLVAFTSEGMHIGNSHTLNGNYASFSNSAVYNNVFVDNHCNINITGFRASNSYIKNNIFWCVSGDCVQASVPSGHSGLTFDYNLWSSIPDVDAQGTHDPTYAAPLLSKTTGWRSMTGGDLTGFDFTLQSTSPCIDKGTNLGSPYDQGLNPASIWPSNVSMLDQDNFGSGWEIGAFVYDNSGIFVKRNINAASEFIELKICPNPSYGKCIVRLNYNSQSMSLKNKLRIYNIAGSLVAELKLKNREFLWDNNSVPNGIYLMKLEGTKNCLSQKLVLIR